MGKPRRSEADRRDAFAIACRYLTGRERCTEEVRLYLRRRGRTDEEIADAIKRLCALRYLDDQRYARLFVESRSRNSPRSGSLLVRELRTKGVDAETARATVADFLREMPESELARRCVEKLGGEGSEWRERAARRLRARGFRPSLALRDWEEEDGSSEPWAD